MSKPIYKMSMQEKLDYYHRLPKDIRPRDYDQLRKTDYEEGQELTITQKSGWFEAGTKVKVISKDLYGYHVSNLDGNLFTWVNEKCVKA